MVNEKFQMFIFFQVPPSPSLLLRSKRHYHVLDPVSRLTVSNALTVDVLVQSHLPGKGLGRAREPGHKVPASRGCLELLVNGEQLFHVPFWRRKNTMLLYGRSEVCYGSMGLCAYGSMGLSTVTDDKGVVENIGVGEQASKNHRAAKPTRVRRIRVEPTLDQLCNAALGEHCHLLHVVLAVVLHRPELALPLCASDAGLGISARVDCARGLHRGVPVVVVVLFVAVST